MSSNKGRNLVIIAGHYCISPELNDLSHKQPVEEISFHEGVKTYANSLNEYAVGDIKLILWVNDIGIEKEERERFKMSYRIPKNYSRILKKYKIEESNVIVSFESSIRNKASKLLRKINKSKPELFKPMNSSSAGLVRCIEDQSCSIETEKKAYTIEGPNGENLVVKEGPNPKCNLILATLFMQYSDATKSTKILNFFNGIYVNRIMLGEHVFRKVMLKEKQHVDFDNTFIDEEDILARSEELYAV